MRVDQATGLVPVFNGAGMQDSAKSIAQRKQPAMVDLYAPTKDSGAGTFFKGSVSLDLSYSRSESLSRDITRTTSQGQQRVRQEFMRRYDASLSLDFSFLAKFDGAAERLKNIDAATFERWANEAGDLFSFSEKDFAEFVTATDELFNEIESVLGLGPEGLDYVAGFFTNQVDRFLDGVKENKDYLDQNKLGEGTDGGLDIPALFDGMKIALPEELKSFLEDALLSLGRGKEDNNDNASKTVFMSVKQLLEEFLTRIEENREIERERNRAETDESLRPESDGSGVPYTGRSARYSSSYSFRQSYQITALLAFGDNQAEAPPINIAA